MPWSDHHGNNEILNATVAIIITSDHLTALPPDEADKQDKTMQTLETFFKEHNFTITKKQRIPNNKEQIKEQVLALVNSGTGLIIVSGGTGLGHRDVSIEAITPLLEKTIPGFGETFRRISYEKIGERGLLSRAIAGIRENTIIMVTPGSPNGTLDAINILFPVIPHIQRLRLK